MVDLTPVLPGGENGGAKLVTIGLVRRLAELARGIDWTLLTSASNHAELGHLEAANVSRFCVSAGTPVNPDQTARWQVRAGRWLTAALPPVYVDRLWSLYARLTRRTAVEPGLPARLSADLLFCPFTAPLHFDPTVPTVSLVHDLQYRYYPQFFSAGDRQARNQHFLDAAELADRLICVSDYVRRTVIDQNVIDPERVVTIQSRLFYRLPEISLADAESVIAPFGLQSGRYLIYPANFWEHKNHKMLLVAFSMYVRRNPAVGLKLVLTGAPGAQQNRIEEAVRKMGLEDSVRFLGFLPDAQFSALLQCCLALIFPSLFEGFGLPTLEAMDRGKPVLCSNVTSLPEVVGEAAIFFDPRKPKEIVNAIEVIVTDASRREELTEKGYQRTAALGDSDRMVREYLRQFEEVWQNPVGQKQNPYGLFADGWVGDSLTIRLSEGSGPREVELTLSVPDWLPHRRVSIWRIQGRTRHLVTRIVRGECKTFRLAVGREAGLLKLAIAPTFRPRAYGINNDERRLACLCQDCRLLGPEGVEYSLCSKSS